MTLERRLGFDHENRHQLRFREWIIALACLLAGILIGRSTLDWNQSDGSVAANSEIELSEFDNSAEKLVNRNSLKSDVGLIDEGLFLMNGQIPVRKYTTIANETVTVVNPKTGKPVEVTVPVRKTIVTASVGT